MIDIDEYDLEDLTDIRALLNVMEDEAEKDVDKIDINDLINRKTKDLVEEDWPKYRDRWQKITGTDDMSDRMIHTFFVATYRSVYARARWDLL